MIDPVSSLQGKWIAWDADQTNILAVADSYLELLKRVASAELADAWIERAPGSPAACELPLPLAAGESTDILRDVHETIPDAEQWLDTPNTRLGLEMPRNLIGTRQEWRLRYLLRGIWSGITS